MPAGQNINMRVPADIRDSIERNAKQNGQTLTDYILSYLPDTYERTTETTADEQRSSAR